MVVLFVVIGLLMLPVVQDSVTTNQEWNNNSTSETNSSLLGMITIFYILGIVLAAVVWVVTEAKKL